MIYGYNGKILWVDLNEESIKVENPSEIWYRTYFGGMGAVAYYLLRNIKFGVDPLGSDNLLIMATGVISGAPFSGSGRNAIGAKSPLTGGFGESDVGGFFGAELKNAGFDMIIFKGRSEKPIWLWVEDGKAELMDASRLWGLEVAECQDGMREEVGEPLAKTALIGPSGEKLARISCILNDVNHAAGRCGLGAVMGSKQLKGVAVRGHKPPEMAHPEQVMMLAQRIASRVSSARAIPTVSRSLHDYGTGAAMDAYEASGNLPTRNFLDGSFEDVSEIDAIAIKKHYSVGMGTCYACAIQCKKMVKLEEPYRVEARYGGPEYETLAALGSNCGISDLAAICKANELCQRYGLDTISTGVTIAFAMECYEKGIITKDMTGDIDLRFGNAEAMIQMVNKIARREGLGDMLAEGVKRAAEKLGNPAQDFAIHVKGQEVPMHDPRLKRGLGLGYAVSPTGADHCHNMHDTIIIGVNLDKLRPLGIHEAVPVNSLKGEKVRMFKYWMEMQVLVNCLSICYFPPWKFIEYVELIRAVTGWDVSMFELVKVAERTLNLARLFNTREGFTSDDDWLPKRFFQPQISGPLYDTAVNAEDLLNAIKLYYEMMGWNEYGIPIRGTLYDLGIEWALDYVS